VSSGYAEGLAQGVLATALSNRAEPLLPVVEGVDYSIFNPATDAALASRYDGEDASNKGRCKTALVRSLELRLDTERPLLVALLHGSASEDTELLTRALPRLLSLDLAIAVIGATDEATASTLASLKAQYPGDLGLSSQSDDADLRRALSAADFTLCLRTRAPSATLELLAQRYGALPIAPATGGIPDVVIDVDAELETGTGILYQPGSEDGLVGAVERALAALSNPRFPTLRRRILRQDLGWDRPARRYAQLYKRLSGDPSLV
jgi:starch synthase